MTARRTKLIKESGPYKLLSFSNGELRVMPEWPNFEPWDEDKGGGPGVISRMRLAREIEAFLNVGTKEGG